MKLKIMTGEEDSNSSEQMEILICVYIVYNYGTFHHTLVTRGKDNAEVGGDRASFCKPFLRYLTLSMHVREGYSSRSVFANSGS